MAVKPEAYTPQLIALGPYHHWSDDVYEMEQYKLSTAKRVQSLFQSNLQFKDLVNKLAKVEHKIRACYHKYLHMDGETLSWMMAIDGLFLLQFLHIYVNKNDSVLANSTRMSFLVDSKGKKLGYDSVLKDILMLENQIPIFVMKKLLKIQFTTRFELPDNLLPPMLLGVCKEIAPLKLNQDSAVSQIMKRAHLLDLLYHLMIPLCDQESEHCPLEDVQKCEGKAQEDFLSNLDHTTVFKELWDKLSGFGFFQKIKNHVNVFEPIISKVATLTGFSNEKSENGNTSNYLQIEEIMIPSVTNLIKAGVKFRATNGDISTITFDKKHKRFHLPVVKLDVNSEVIMRNLVAYEASAISGPLVFARYTELMNGIVDTAEDAKILADNGIIKSELRYDKVADIWNGMSKSIRLTHVGFIDETIKEVNSYFHSTTRVKIYSMTKAYVYGSWRMLVLLASLLVIGLMFLQSFCTIYDCPKILHTVTDEK